MTTGSIYGMPLRVIMDVPRRQVSLEFTEIQTYQLVESTNKWLREFFGVTNLLHHGEIIHNRVENSRYMSESTYHQLKASGLIMDNHPVFNPS